MNERIKELAEQADWWIPLGLPSDWNEGDYVVSPTQLEKFAQLIVRECAGICFSEAAGHGMAFGEHCGIIIKEHFGVE